VPAGAPGFATSWAANALVGERNGPCALPPLAVQPEIHRNRHAVGLIPGTYVSRMGYPQSLDRVASQAECVRLREEPVRFQHRFYVNVASAAGPGILEMRVGIGRGIFRPFSRCRGNGKQRKGQEQGEEESPGFASRHLSAYLPARHTAPNSILPHFPAESNRGYPTAPGRA
jgi:hypothetical protein